MALFLILILFVTLAFPQSVNALTPLPCLIGPRETSVVQGDIIIIYGWNLLSNVENTSAQIRISHITDTFSKTYVAEYHDPIFSIPVEITPEYTLGNYSIEFVSNRDFTYCTERGFEVGSAPTQVPESKFSEFLPTQNEIGPDWEIESISTAWIHDELEIKDGICKDYIGKDFSYFSLRTCLGTINDVQLLEQFFQDKLDLVKPHSANLDLEVVEHYETFIVNISGIDGCLGYQFVSEVSMIPGSTKKGSITLACYTDNVYFEIKKTEQDTDLVYYPFSQEHHQKFGNIIIEKLGIQTDSEGPTTDEPPSPPALPPIEEGGILSPIKQVSQGIEPEAVICKEGLVLIMKNNGSPACVRLETAIKLEERGWGVMPPPCCKDMPHLFTTEAVLGIAQEFIKSSPTFAFDGMPETLEVELVAIRESFPEQYVIEADFDSLHGGYGDRTDQMVIQVITPHSMNLVVINGEVTSAILDGKWDELNQLQLPWTPTKGPDETVSHGGPVTDYISLIDNLRANDATVNPEGEIEQPFFSVTGFSIQVNGASVQVFEYDTAEDAEADASLVSEDGSSIGNGTGTSMPFWVSDPHFYYKERIIVLYVGDDPNIVELLESVLESQFAGR